MTDRWKRLISHATLTLFCLAGLPLTTAGEDEDEATPSPLQYEEVYDLLKSQVKEVDEASLQDAAAHALIEHLHPKVRLLGLPDEETDPEVAGDEARTQSSVFDKKYGYLHVPVFAKDNRKELSKTLRALIKTNKLSGLILDLRFSKGEDYPSALAFSDLFFAEEKALLNWGQGARKSQSKTNAIALPLAVLINHGTTGAAEAVAGVLRESGAGLLIGAHTAGEASIYREFKLTTGQTLQIATQAVTVGEDNPLTSEGLKPDIQVLVDEPSERAWMKDPYDDSIQLSNAGEDNGSTRRRLNEADLVRMMKEGDIPEEETANRQPVVRDPVLARALDFLKGLNLLRQFQSI